MSTPPPADASSSKTLTQSNSNQLVQVVLFTQEDELHLLNCYLQIARSANPTNNNSNSHHPTLDSSALDRIETALGPKFSHSHSHIADKLHRLKLHYHKLARTKSFVKTPHDRRILQIGRSIWGKPPSPSPAPKPDLILRRIKGIRSQNPPVGRKKGVDLKNFPLLVSEFSRQLPGNVVWREGLRGMEQSLLRGMNEKWVLLHIQEAELKARRAALLHLQQQFRVTDDTSQLLNFNTN